MDAELQDCFELLAAGDVLVPERYITLAHAGMLDYGVSRQDWGDNLVHYLLEAPPALLCHASLSWHPPRDLHMWETPDYWNLPGLMGFAGNGCGDHWCWQRVPEADQSRVLFCIHDEDCFEVFAADFDDFLARMLAESLAELEGEGVLDGPTQVAQHLRACVERLLPHVAPHHRVFFEALVGRTLRKTETPTGVVYRLIEPDELAAFLGPILARPGVGVVSAYPRTAAVR